MKTVLLKIFLKIHGMIMYLYSFLTWGEWKTCNNFIFNNKIFKIIYIKEDILTYFNLEGGMSLRVEVITNKASPIYMIVSLRLKNEFLMWTLAYKFWLRNPGMTFAMGIYGISGLGSNGLVFLHTSHTRDLIQSSHSHNLCKLEHW